MLLEAFDARFGAILDTLVNTGHRTTLSRLVQTQQLGTIDPPVDDTEATFNVNPPR